MTFLAPALECKCSLYITYARKAHFLWQLIIQIDFDGGDALAEHCGQARFPLIGEYIHESYRVGHACAADLLHSKCCIFDLLFNNNKRWTKLKDIANYKNT